MTRLRIGTKPGVGPVVKVMVDELDDPFTTSSQDIAKFRFDSENQNYGYVVQVAECSLDFTGMGYANAWKYVPTGDPWTSYLWLSQIQSGGSTYQRFGTIRVDAIAPEGNYFVFAQLATSDWKRRWTTFSNPVQRFVEPNVYVVEVDHVPPGANPVAYIPPNERVRLRTLQSRNTPFGEGRVGTFPNAVMSRWNVFKTNLPRDDVAYPPAGPAPVAGQHVLRISPTQVRMARPGYTIADADDLMILSSNRVPIKIVAAGLLTIPAGGVQTVTPIVPIDENVYVEFSVQGPGAQLLIPPFGEINEGALVEHRVAGGNVEFRNLSSKTLEVRYFVLAEGTTPQSVGSAKVLERLPDGNVVIRKPGTAGTSLRDTILDTRLPFVPIVAQGFIPWTAFVGSDTATRGTHMALVNFDNPGAKFRPHPIWVAKLQRIAAPNDIIFRDPNAVFLTAASPDRFGAQSVMCQVQDTQVKFYAWRGSTNPTLVETGPYNIEYDPYQWIGIRFFIFAIPTDL